MPRPSPEHARSRRLAFDGPQRSIYSADGGHDRHDGKAWSVMDVEDPRDYAKVVTTDDLATLLMRSRHEAPKKLIELGVAPLKGPSGTSSAADGFRRIGCRGQLTICVRTPSEVSFDL